MSSIDLNSLDPLNPPVPTYYQTIPPVLDVPFGVCGMPAGVKETGQRADFRTDSFTILIESKGYRLAWTRNTLCPCKPTNTQTRQADPNCTLCYGAGFFYFGPTAKQDVNTIGALNDVQQAIIAKQNAFVIRGVMTALTKNDSPWEKIGSWATGEANLTVRTENKLSYYDRLVMLDSVIPYREVVCANDGPTLPTRYLVDGGINLVMDLSGKRYTNDSDFTLVRGQITWVSGGMRPANGTRMALHYNTHPTWLVMSLMHVIRDTNVKYKQPYPPSVEGAQYQMPISVAAKMEYLVDPSERINL